MAIAFIADLHLTPERPAATAWFEVFMRAARVQLQAVYILGDLFEVWIGDDGNEILRQTTVEKILAATAAAGVQLFFMHGNRDFLVGRAFAARSGCTLLPDPSVITLDDTRIVLSHGDALCRDDVAHQQARATMLSSKWQFAFLQQPVETRLSTALAMRATSATTKSQKDMQMMDVQQAAVEEMMLAHAANAMIHGHTHQPAVHDFHLNGQSARRYVLGDWYEQKSVLLYDHGCFSLRR